MERAKALAIHEAVFGNYRIQFVEDGGEYLVIMKPLCERIGLNWESQRKLIDRDPVLNSVAIRVKATAKDGKRREMVCMPIHYLNGWLFKIDTTRYEGELKDRIIRYQKECYNTVFQPLMEHSLKRRV